MEAITATYEEHDDDWSVTVAGMGQELTERAPGIIAARDQAEQLVESLKPEEGETAVVHLLRGSALDFTTAYMTARLGRTGDTGADSAAEPAVPEQGYSAQNHPEQDYGAADETPTEDSGNTEDSDNSAQELAK